MAHKKKKSKAEKTRKMIRDVFKNTEMLRKKRAKLRAKKKKNK